jgi:hypothetical protein
MTRHQIALTAGIALVVAVGVQLAAGALKTAQVNGCVQTAIQDLSTYRGLAVEAAACRALFN